MTETSPVATAGAPPLDWEGWPKDRKLDFLMKQGQIPFGIELRIVDDEGGELPRDGATSGRLQVRGAWVIRRYYRAEADALDGEGWFDTGDVAILHPDGTMQITDRAKDVIKSGGEWISSVDLENAAVGCPGVAEAAAIGVVHPRWDERPLLLVVAKPGSGVTAEAIRAHLATKVAKWWLPDEILFVDDLPHTATGKLLKTELRARYRHHQLAGSELPA
jgi:fatty-acyl-CoA synthase